MSKEESPVLEIPDLSRNPDPIFLYNQNCNKQSIIIDNGSFECKVGWICDGKPRMIFKSHSTKLRGKKDSEVLVGNDIANYESSGWMPLKSPFEKNIMTHPDIQEHIMDHIFTHFDLSSKSSIEHAVVMTEPLCNPNYCRQYMSELLFECYGVPAVLYGIDSMLSLDYNVPLAESALVISLGHSVCHVIPYLNGEIRFKEAKRVSYGGQNVTSYLQRLIQLKHPHLAMAVTPMKAEYLAHNYCRYALNYEEGALRFKEKEYSDENTVRIQLPFNSIQASASATTTSGKMDVCHAIVQRVETVMSKKHQTSLVDNQEKLNQLQSIHEMVTYDEDKNRMKTINDLGFTSVKELETVMDDLRQRVESVLQSQLPSEVDLIHFSDPDSWLMALRKLKEELKYKVSVKIYEQKSENSINDQDMIDRLDLIIFETEREFKRNSKISTDHLKSSSGVALFYQLVLATERYRAPEVLFQPAAMIGSDQAGLVETIDGVFKQFSDEDQNKMAETIFVTGGPACMPGLKERIEKEVLALRPFKSDFTVRMANNAVLNAWHGAQKIALIGGIDQFGIRRSDYDEFGPDYIKRYKSSNVYAPSPLVVRI